MSVVTIPIPSSAPGPALLENGDHLSRPEFERRYELAPPDFHAELVEGIVYVASPVRARDHGEPHTLMVGWLLAYQDATLGIRTSIDASVGLDADNVVQPDILVRIESGGTTFVTTKGYLEGAPELVVEITASTASYDLHEKLRAYRRAGVRDYVVWRVVDRAVDWLVLRDGTYVRAEPGADGLIRASAFPGLWLDVEGVLEDDFPRVRAGVARGIAEDPGYEEFVSRLRG